MRTVRVPCSPSYPSPGREWALGSLGPWSPGCGPARERPLERVSPSPARGAMAHVGSRKRSRSRSRSRGRGSEKRRKKSSKDATKSCSASRSQGRKASTTTSGAEGEDQREWGRGAGTSRRKLQAAGGLPGAGCGEIATSSSQEWCRSVEVGIWIERHPESRGWAGPLRMDNLVGPLKRAFCASGPELWRLASLLLVRQ